MRYNRVATQWSTLNISNIQLLWIIVFVGYHKRRFSSNNLLYNDFKNPFGCIMLCNCPDPRFDMILAIATITSSWITSKFTRPPTLKSTRFAKCLSNCNTTIKWDAWNSSHEYHCRFLLWRRSYCWWSPCSIRTFFLEKNTQCHCFFYLVQ